MRLAALGSTPALILATTTLAAQASTEPPRQTEADAYSRYELLAPGSARFRIVYEVSATTPGARYYFNPIRKGSVSSDERVTSPARMTSSTPSDKPSPASRSLPATKMTAP